MSSLLGYFNFSHTPKHSTPQAPRNENKHPDEKHPVRALPASWYTSPHMYTFERRAIFANRWLFMTTVLRIPREGDCVGYRFAGFDVLVYRDGEGVGARHGVSTEGRMEEGMLDDGLRIHTHVDRNGFIWINLDASLTPSIPFDQFFHDVDVQERYSTIDFDNYVLDHVYELHSAYNWKLAADNFNECYHCPTTHPDIPAFLNLDSFDSACRDSHIQHACAPTQEQIDLGVNVHSTYYFPCASMTVGKHFLMVQKFLPRSAGRTTCHYEVFRARGSSAEEFHRIADMYARVMGEDKVLCERAQANLERGVFQAGLLHPRWEKAPLFFQQRCREAVRGHWEVERGLGRVVQPAARKGLVLDGAEGARAGDEGGDVGGGKDGAGKGGGKEVLVW